MALRSPPRPRPPDGRALSSVVAAVLLVAIAVAMAALVYAWAAGFIGSVGTKVPSAEAAVVGCSVGADAVTAELEQGGPLGRTDLAAQLTKETSGNEEARTDPLDSGGGNWDPRSRLTSDDPLDRPEWNATLYNTTTGDLVAVADPLDDAGVWRPSQALTFHEGGRATGIQWDGPITGGLEDGGTYRLDLTHLVSGETRAEVTFAC